MPAGAKTGPRFGLLLGLLFLFVLVLFAELVAHPGTVAPLGLFLGPSALACDLRCLGTAPFLQVLAGTGKGFALILLSLSFLYALIRASLRIVRTWRFVERVQRSPRARREAAPSWLTADAAIFASSRPLAFTAGYMKPRIFVSSGLLEALDENELRAVISHEAHHRDSRDPLKALALGFVSDLLFFLPVSPFLRRACLLESEMAADARAARLETGPLEVAGSLLKVRKLAGVQASWFFDPTEERVKRLLGMPAGLLPSFRRVGLTIVLLTATVFVALVPVKRSLSSMFINHDKTCVLRAGRTLPR